MTFGNTIGGKYKLFACLFMIFPALAAAQDQQLYQIKWQYHGSTGYFAPFNDSEDGATRRLRMATTSNPLASLSLVEPAEKPHKWSFPQSVDVSERSRRMYLFSVAAFNAVNILDITSSYGKQELNPLLAGNNQRFDMSSAGKKLAMVGAIDASQIFALRRQPATRRRLAIANFVMSGILAGVVAHNYGISVHH
jgi:hypothetical protein